MYDGLQLEQMCFSFTVKIHHICEVLHKWTQTAWDWFYVFEQCDDVWCFICKFRGYFKFYCTSSETHRTLCTFTEFNITVVVTSCFALMIPLYLITYNNFLSFSVHIYAWKHLMQLRLNHEDDWFLNYFKFDCFLGCAGECRWVGGALVDDGVQCLCQVNVLWADWCQTGLSSTD